jgi:Ion channel
MDDFTARLRDEWGDRLLTVLTALLAFMLFVIAPLQALGYFFFQIFEFTLAVILVACVFVLSGSRVAGITMILGLLMLALGAVVRAKWPSPIDIDLFVGSWLILGTTVAWVVARAVFGGGRVTHHRVMGAVLLYFTVAVLFAATYRLVGAIVPKAFAGMTMEDNPALASQLVYFSFATLTTTGYGDIAPVHPVARSLCNLEAIFGQLYPATLLARLVTLELAHRDSYEADD